MSTPMAIAVCSRSGGRCSSPSFPSAFALSMKSARWPGTDPGAPVAPRLLMKALATTVVSAIVFACVYLYVLWMS